MEFRCDRKGCNRQAKIFTEVYLPEEDRQRTMWLCEECQKRFVMNTEDFINNCNQRYAYKIGEADVQFMEEHSYKDAVGRSWKVEHIYNVLGNTVLMVRESGLTSKKRCIAVVDTPNRATVMLGGGITTLYGEKG